MRVWTKGLGNITLNIDFNQSEIHWEDDTLFLTGWIKDPVVWNYRFTPDDHDIKALVKLFFNRHVIRFVLKYTIGKWFSFLNRPRKPDDIS